jgi:hypothetical protein
MKEYSTTDCENLFQTLFPNGFANPDVMHSIAPNGWENSPFVLPVPTLEEAYETAKAHKSLENLMARINSEPQTDMESFEDFTLHYTPVIIDPTIALQDLVGSCVWDVFSDNNDVVKDNKRYHLGSFRGSAGFIADWLNQKSEKEYEYMDFYMGTSVKDDEDADFMPVYLWIFKQIKQAGCDWVFNFTELRLVDMSSEKNQTPDKLENYDPNNAMAQELKQQEEQKAKDDFKSKIEDMNAKARENALYKPPPQVVQAYKAVFGEYPKGWPPL